MVPILFSFGQFSLPSFGLFLALGLILGTILVWRQARAWDLDEEKVLDLTLLAFFGGLIGARIYFVLLHFNFFFSEPIKIFLFNRYPGFSFWGGLLSGILILILFSKKFKLNIWQIGDIAILGLLGGLVFGDIGCFFGGCGIGIESNLFFASPVVGLVGKRFPIQAVEGFAALFLLLTLWPQALKFHIFGKILSKGLIYLGIVKLILEGYRDQKVSGVIWGIGGYVFSIALIVAGIFVYYKVSKRNILSDIKLFFVGLGRFIINNRFRKALLVYFWKSCYNKIRKTLTNTKVSIKWKFRGLSKILRKLHVKPTPKNIKPY